MLKPEHVWWQNDGERVVETNYFDSLSARMGGTFMTANAGALRLFIPKSIDSCLKDILSARCVVIARGIYREAMTRMYELMFEDDSESPFAIWIGPKQIGTGEINMTDAASRPRNFYVYTDHGGLTWVKTFPAYFREAEFLPCLKPWDGAK